jgi:hypothetical protein
MKNTLDTLSIKLAFNPFDKELRHHCFTMSKKYNKLRKAKRRAHYSDMMFKLNSLSDTNPKAFWDLVNESEMGKSNSFIRSLDLSILKRLSNFSLSTAFSVDRVFNFLK